MTEINWLETPEPVAKFCPLIKASCHPQCMWWMDGCALMMGVDEYIDAMVRFGERMRHEPGLRVDSCFRMQEDDGR